MRFQCIGPRSKSATRYQPQVEIDISPGRSQAGIENSGSEPFRPQAEMIPAQGGGRSKSDPGSRIIPASGRNDSGPGGRQVGVSVPDSGLGRNRFRPEAGAGARGEPGRRPPPPPGRWLLLRRRRRWAAAEAVAAPATAAASALPQSSTRHGGACPYQVPISKFCAIPYGGLGDMCSASSQIGRSHKSGV